MVGPWQTVADLMHRKVHIARDNVRAAERELDMRKAELGAYVEACDIFNAHAPKDKP